MATIQINSSKKRKGRETYIPIYIYQYKFYSFIYGHDLALNNIYIYILITYI